MKDRLQIDFNLYKSFYFVAKEKSFSKAAQSLFVTQPLVSCNIKTLESLLGVKLFDRTTKNVLLTPAGRSLFSQIESCYGMLVETERNIKLLKEEDGGEIIVGATNDIASYLIPAFISEFAKKYSNVKFKVFDREKDVILSALKDRTMDVVFISDPEIKDDNKFIYDAIFATKGCFVGPQEKVEDKLYNIKEFDGKAFALPASGLTRRRIQSILDENEVFANVVLETNSTNIGINMINSNIDVAYFYEGFVKELLKQRGLKKYNTDIDFPKVNIFMIYNQKHNSNATNNFIQFIKDNQIKHD